MLSGGQVILADRRDRFQCLFSGRCGVDGESKPCMHFQKTLGGALSLRMSIVMYVYIWHQIYLRVKV